MELHANLIGWFLLAYVPVDYKVSSLPNSQAMSQQQKLAFPSPVNTVLNVILSVSS